MEIIENAATIAEKNVQRFFQSVKEGHKDLGFWCPNGSGAANQFVLPNGLRIKNSLGKRWLAFNQKA